MPSRFSCVSLFATHGLQPTRLLCPGDSPGKNTGVSCHALLQGIFPTQGSNPCLLHWEVGSTPGSGRSPGGGNGSPLQYSCLENPLDRGAWWATVRGVAKSRTRLSTHEQLLIRSKSLRPAQYLKVRELDLLTGVVSNHMQTCVKLPRLLQALY